MTSTRWRSTAGCSIHVKYCVIWIWKSSLLICIRFMWVFFLTIWLVTAECCLQEGIQPMWEDERNKLGGRWLVNLDKRKRGVELDRFWLETVSIIPAALSQWQFDSAVDKYSLLTYQLLIITCTAFRAPCTPAIYWISGQIDHCWKDEIHLTCFQKRPVLWSAARASSV